MKKILIISIIGILIINCFGAMALSTNKNINTSKIEKCNFTFSFSNPEIKDIGEYLKIEIKEANNYMTNSGNYMLPYISFVQTFPLGTKIIDMKYISIEPKEIHLSKNIYKNPQTQLNKDNSYMNKFSNNFPLYHQKKSNQDNWYTYKIGGGINNREHVIFLSIQLYPIQYKSEENLIQFVNKIEIEISYERPANLPTSNEQFSMVIITPSAFEESLKTLVTHKNNINLPTKLVTLEDIYSSEYFPVDGRDEAEKIKYFIKNAVEQWDTDYVMLVGDINKIPIRKTWMGNEMDILTDLYYADLFNSDGSFCSWDSNNNGLFGEYAHNGFYDLVDLYPDVYIGRIPCSYKFDVKNVVNKIITYEKTTYTSDWFKNLILCGGDTFPGYGVFEGEVVSDCIAENMPEFNHIRLWTSTNTFNHNTINNAINNGAGFLAYSGHGYEVGFGTSPPNENQRIEYFNRYLFDLSNKNKLPVIFFDACSTATLDYTLGKFLGVDLIKIPFPTFAWNLVRMIGGAIATIGATRVAYTNVDENGPHAGAGYLVLQFFKSYNEGITVGEMFVSAKNDYLNNIFKDPFTVEEFILIGDPSLKVGGYHEL